MSRLMKWFTILGIICSLLGIGVITAGAMMGGVEDVKNYAGRYDGYLSSHTPPATAAGGDAGGDRMTPEGRTDWNQASMTNTASYPDVKKLKIEAGPGEVMIRAEDREVSQDTAIRVERYAREGVLIYTYDIRKNRDELEIERNYEFRNIVSPGKDHSEEHAEEYRGRHMEALIIYVPRNYQFREVEIEAAAAEVTVEEIYADKLELELKAGEMTIESANAGELDAECKVGSMYIGMEGKKEQYNYELECSLGTITLEGGEEETYTGLHQDKYIDNHAGRTAKLDCETGAIKVGFAETE